MSRGQGPISPGAKPRRDSGPPGPLDQEETLYTMRLKIFQPWLCLLPIALFGLGCASTGGFGQPSGEPKITTIAAVGERPVSAVAGVPTSSAVADLDPPEPSRDREGRVAGRVVDDRGNPVKGALVRIADGGTSGGRVIEAKTDRAGGFTLHGLRPGTRYTLIAEYEDRNGELISGRWNGRSPQSSVEIAIHADDLPDDQRRADRTSPARTISDRQAIDDEQADVGRGSRKVNPDDLATGSDVEDIDDLASAPSRTRFVGAVAASGWRKSRVLLGGEKALGSSTDAAARRVSTAEAGAGESEDPKVVRVPRRPVDDPPASVEDDGENPLPLAIDRAEARSRSARRDRDPEEPDPGPRPSQRTSKADKPGPGIQPGALILAKDAPVEVSPPASAPRPRPRPSVETPADPEPLAWTKREETAATSTGGAGAAPKKYTWRDVSDAWSGSPEVEQTASISREGPETRQAAFVDELPPVTPRTDAPSTSRTRRAEPVTPDSGPAELCRYDPQRQQINDFRAPDLDGRPVSLGDFDADYVLLDFWGTWCRPCMTSVPHLVDLQKRLGSKRLAVVGVACEEGPPSSNVAHVADVAKRLGINYTVLVSTKDGTSPLQQSLHVQAFPTLVLLDRKGRIVWRGVGATSTTLSRLDRMLDSATRTAASDGVRRK
jgi:thiol-disulfide isomerase/thioredoxin